MGEDPGTESGDPGGVGSGDPEGVENGDPGGVENDAKEGEGEDCGEVTGSEGDDDIRGGEGGTLTSVGSLGSVTWTTPSASFSMTTTLLGSMALDVALGLRCCRLRCFFFTGLLPESLARPFGRLGGVTMGRLRCNFISRSSLSCWSAPTVSSSNFSSTGCRGGNLTAGEGVGGRQWRPYIIRPQKLETDIPPGTQFSIPPEEYFKSMVVYFF